ncbi:hypothetical protein BJV74DRAFT_852226 [Russula compacta]|nr:hypothetical protein BJV74DRAFT_852226 [Russula compacta]
MSSASQVIEQYGQSNFDGSHDNYRHQNTRQKPEKAKKAAEWRRAVEGHAPLRTTYAPPIDRALGNDRKGDRKDHLQSELAGNVAMNSGIHTAIHEVPFHQNERARPLDNSGSPLCPVPMAPPPDWISTLNIPSTVQMLSSQDVASVLPWFPPSDDLHHGYSISRATFSPSFLALSRAPSAPLSTYKDRQCVHPSDWTVEETVDWLRSNGFEEAVCEKFIEQEAAGDALLSLDVTKLKNEIGIIAYGKRIRIASAIADLRRTANLMFSSAKQPTRPKPSSHAGLPEPQRMALKPALIRSASQGNLLALPDSISGDGPRAPLMPARRDQDLGVRSTADKPADSEVTTKNQVWISTSGSGQGHTVNGRPSHLSPRPGDGTFGLNTEGEVVEYKGGKRNRVVPGISSTNDLATQHSDNLFDGGSPSSSTAKLSSPHSMVLATPLPEVTQLNRRSKSLHDVRKGRSDTTNENSRPKVSGSSLAGIRSLVPELRRRSSVAETETSSDRMVRSPSRLHQSNGNNTSSLLSQAVGADAYHRKEAKREKRLSNDSDGSKEDLILSRNRGWSSRDASFHPWTDAGTPTLTQGTLAQIGVADHAGWMRKKDGHHNSWKNYYFMLRGPHLYWLKNDNLSAKVEGRVDIAGYRIIPDENIDPGRYGFKLLHELDPPHYFSSDDKTAIREWIKAIMKPNIKRDHTKAIAHPVNVTAVSLAAAQAMHPRPPSPPARAVIQRYMRRLHEEQLPTRDVDILMGNQPAALSHSEHDKIRGQVRTGSSFIELEEEDPVSQSTSTKPQVPARPPRNTRRDGTRPEHPFADSDLIKRAQSPLSGTRITSKIPINGKSELLQTAESIGDTRSLNSSGSAFLNGLDNDVLEILISLIGFLLGDDLKVGNADIDVRQDKIIELLRTLCAWGEEYRASRQSVGKSPMQAAGPSAA